MVKRKRIIDVEETIDSSSMNQRRKPRIAMNSTLDKFLASNRPFRDHKMDAVTSGQMDKKPPLLQQVYASHLRSPHKLSMTDAEVFYYSSFLSPTSCTSLYSTLTSLPYWQRPTFKIFGRQAHAARLTCSFSSHPDKEYRYSGTIAGADAPTYPLPIKQVKDSLEHLLDEKFNFVLLNWYKDGNDSIGEHADDERGLVPNGSIACVSVGAERTLVFRKKNEKSQMKKVILEVGSLIVMKGETQKFWKHGIPKERKVLGGRISLTFRQLE